MADAQLDEALSTFVELEGLETRHDSGAFTADVFEDTMSNAEERLGQLLDDPEVRAALQSELYEVRADEESATFLSGLSITNPEDVEGLKISIAERRAKPLFRMAQRFLGVASVDEAADLEAASDEETISNDKFFDRSPSKVAQDLEGRELELVTGKGHANRGTILVVKAQSPKDNANWIEKRPLFGKNPVDGYVAPYRGNHMLFLRTGPKNTCVRIDQLEIGGEKLKNPGQVCKALGLTEEQSYRVVFDGKQVRVLPLIESMR